MVSVIRSGVLSNQIRTPSRRQPHAATESQPAQKDSSSTHIEPALTTFGPEPVARQSAEDLKAMIEAARLSVLAQLKEEVEAAREMARQRGLQEGRAEGLEESRQTFAKEIARLKTLTESIPKMFETQVHALEDVLVDIAFQAVCKVLGPAAITVDGIQAMVQQATSQTLAQEKMRVRLHPADLALLVKADVLNNNSPHVKAEWLADKRVELGGCMLETNGGELDARLETQIDKLRTVLLQARSGATGLVE